MNTLKEIHMQPDTMYHGDYRSVQSYPAASREAKLAGHAAELFEFDQQGLQFLAVLKTVGTEPPLEVCITVRKCFKTVILLEDILQAFAQGSVRLTNPLEPTHRWAKSAMLGVLPFSAGQDVDVYKTTQGIVWTHIAARPRCDGTGARYEGFNLYTSDPWLAERIAANVQNGQIFMRGGHMSPRAAERLPEFA